MATFTQSHTIINVLRRNTAGLTPEKLVDKIIQEDPKSISLRFLCYRGRLP